jgi:hypothetical protein
MIKPVNLNGKYLESESSSEYASKNSSDLAAVASRNAKKKMSEHLNASLMSGMQNASMLISRGPELESRTGAIVEGFRIIKEIGKGSFSTVYKARKDKTIQEYVNILICINFGSQSGNQDHRQTKVRTNYKKGKIGSKNRPRDQNNEKNCKPHCLLSFSFFRTTRTL